MVCQTPKNQQPPIPAPEKITWANVTSQTVFANGPRSGTECETGVSGMVISDAAFERLSRLMATRGAKEEGLRVAVQGGGCAGLAYKLTWDPKPQDKDKIFAREGVRVFVDPKSYLFLIGSMIDYEEDLLQAGFKITNPRAKATCGCGESFSV